MTKMHTIRSRVRHLFGDGMAGPDIIATVAEEFTQISRRSIYSAMRDVRQEMGLSRRRVSWSEPASFRLMIESDINRRFEEEARRLNVSKRRLASRLIEILTTTPNMIDNVLDGDL